MTFFYYLPGATRAELSPALLRERGLGSIFREATRTAAACARETASRQVHASGPDGGNGLLLRAAGPGDEQLGYFADRQTWLRGSQGRFWAGHSADALPGPEDLRRSGALEGYWHTLGDEREWEIPIVRRAGKYPELPQSLGLDGEGHFGMQVLPDFAGAWRDSGTIFDHVLRQKSLPWRQAFDLCVSMLSLNYRLGPLEASVLGLITTANYEFVFQAAIDWPKIKELLGPQLPAPEEGDAPQKKSPATWAPRPTASPSTSPGPAESSLITPPPAEISSY